MGPESILKRPIILTEKSNQLREQGKVIFEVARGANKIQIRDAVQKMFKVTVTDVHTMVYRGKDRRMGRGYAKLQNWKKAVITLKAGDTIQFFDESEGGESAASTGEEQASKGLALIAYEKVASHAYQELQADVPRSALFQRPREQGHHQDRA